VKFLSAGTRDVRFRPPTGAEPGWDPHRNMGGVVRAIRRNGGAHVIPPPGISEASGPWGNSGQGPEVRRTVMTVDERLDSLWATVEGSASERRLAAIKAAINKLRTRTGPKIAADFDYQSLGEAAIKARLAAARIRRYPRGAATEIGRDLLAAKVAMAHGQFMAWVEAECRISVSTADRAMRAARLALLRDQATWRRSREKLPPERAWDRNDQSYLSQPLAPWGLRPSALPGVDDRDRSIDRGPQMGPSVAEEIGGLRVTRLPASAL